MANPSINIAIGENGGKYITSFHKHFNKQEKHLKNLASFYQFQIDEKTLLFNSIDRVSDLDLRFGSLDSENSLAEELKKEEVVYNLNNQINKAYNNMINLTNQIDQVMRFDVVNINIVFNGSEENNTVLLQSLINSINALSESGITANISVKAFVVLANNGDLLRPEQQVITYQNLEELKSIQNQNRNIFHNTVFIDDKNTGAVYLRMNDESIGFALNEMVTYLMENHYQMVSNLQNADYLSIGIGCLYFDSENFNQFFKKKILNELVLDELNIGANNPISTVQYDKLRDDYLIPYLNGEIKDLPVEAIKKSLSELSNYTTIEYQFTLANLLNRFDNVDAGKKILNVEKISITDLIFEETATINKGTEDENSFSILCHKKKLDAFDSKQKQLSELLLVPQMKETTNQIETLKTEIEKEAKNIEHQKLELVNTHIMAIKLFGIASTSKEPKNRLTVELNNLKQTKKELNDKLNSFIYTCVLIKWLFKSRYKQLKQNIEKVQQEIEIKENELSSGFKPSRLESLFKLNRELSKLYDILENSISTTKDLNNEVNSQFDADSIQFFFVKHVTNTKVLTQYFNQHKTSLMSGFSDFLNQSIIPRKNMYEFNNILNSKIDTAISGTFNTNNFNIINYLNLDYSDSGLFVEEKFSTTILSLKNISKPFFNSRNTHNTKNSHRLILHNTEVPQNVQSFNQQLKNQYTADIPQHIPTVHSNKLSLLYIDIIKDLSDIVKYSDSEKTYNQRNKETNISKVS